MFDIASSSILFVKSSTEKNVRSNNDSELLLSEREINVCSIIFE